MTRAGVLPAKLTPSIRDTTYRTGCGGDGWWWRASACSPGRSCPVSCAISIDYRTRWRRMRPLTHFRRFDALQPAQVGTACEIDDVHSLRFDPRAEDRFPRLSLSVSDGGERLLIGVYPSVDWKVLTVSRRDRRLFRFAAGKRSVRFRFLKAATRHLELATQGVGQFRRRMRDGAVLDGKSRRCWSPLRSNV